MSEDNKIIIRRMYEEFNQGNLDAASEYVATNFIRNGELVGREGDRQRDELYTVAFPDLRSTIDDIIAEGAKVVVRWTMTGTHRGELMGIPPTGKQIEIAGISIYRIENGMIAEVWECADRLGLRQQLGLIP